MDTLLSEIEVFCKAHDLSEWQFGDLALKDRYFIRQLGKGREPRSATVGRVRQFMASYKAEARAA
jgi:hypothetical protein